IVAEWHSLQLRDGNTHGIEADVNAPSAVDHLAHVRLDRLFVERIGLACLRRHAAEAELAGERPERLDAATGEEQPRALPCEGIGYRRSDGAGGSVDDGDLVLEHHARVS